MKSLPKVANPKRQIYLSDMSDDQWEVIRPLLPSPKGFGRPRTVDLREILNAIFYVQRTGCQWEMLPHDFPPHQTVYRYFSKWQRRGIWKKLHDQLRCKLRQNLGRHQDSTVAIADSQSVKTTEKRVRYTVTTAAKKLKDVSAISLSILKGY